MESRNIKTLISAFLSLFTRPLQKSHWSHFLAYKVSKTSLLLSEIVTKKERPILKERDERSQERERPILFLLRSLDLSFSQADLLLSLMPNYASDL